MRGTALVITADSAGWARQAAISMTGFATSIIACGVEAGIDAELAEESTPDGRPGVRVLLFAGSSTELQKQVTNRSASACSPAWARPASLGSRRRTRSRWATRCAISATAGRSASGSAAGTTGVFR